MSNDINVLNYTITTNLEALDLNKKAIVNTINPHSYCVAKKDSEFTKALNSSDVLLPDGVGIVWAANTLKGQKIKKIAGYDLFVFLMNKLNQENGKCFFLGASDITLELITKRAKKEYPNVKVQTYSPPYKSKFSVEDNNAIYKVINDFKPHVLFVGMTAPKQEKWVFENNSNINANLICSIGAVFDFYAGTVKRPSQFWISLGLEWLPRFFKEPKRLAERNLVSTPKFILEVLSFKLRNKGVL